MAKYNKRYIDKELQNWAKQTDRKPLLLRGARQVGKTTAVRHLSENGSIVALVKPQFEAGREQMKNSKGIVRDPAIHEETIRKVCGSAAENGLSVAGLTYSPVTGTKGNIEYLLYLVRNSVFNRNDLGYNQDMLRRIVKESHAVLTEEKGDYR